MRIISTLSPVLLCVLLLTGPTIPASYCQEAGSMSSAPQGGTDSATLKWEAPTKNTDGTPLTDLAGYKIYYDPVSRGYDHKEPKKKLALDDKELKCKKIDTKTECTYIVSNLGGGTHYFSVTAYTKSGKESVYSNEVKK